MRKVDWKGKASIWVINHISFHQEVNKIARGMKYEHVFKKLWNRILKEEVCPWDITGLCFGDEEVDPVLCVRSYIGTCWCRFRKELEGK